MSEVVQPKKRRTWRTWLFRAALVLMALVATGMVAVWWRLSSEYADGKGMLAAIIAELDESDPGWRWDDIEASRAPLPEGRNSALVVKRVVDSLGGWKVWDRKRPDGRPVIILDAAINRRLDDAGLTILREEFAGHEPSIALAAGLKDYPQGRMVIRLATNPLDTPVPHLEAPRAVGHLLQLDIERLLHDGRIAETPDRVRAILRMGDSLRDDPLLLGALLRMAMRQIAGRRVQRILAIGELSDAACQRLMADLEAQQGENVLLTGVRGERAMHHQLFENLTSGRLTLSRVADARPPYGLMLRLNGWIYSYREPEDHAYTLRRMTDLYEVALLPVEEMPEAVKDFAAEVKASRATAVPQGRRVLSHLLISSFVKVAEAAIRDHASLSCVHAGLAAERYRLAHKRWPTALADLVPKYLSEVPTDPYTGDPIRYAKCEGGIVIYSVGQDGTDNGGEVDAPGNQLAPDFGVRLFDPAQRGLPAVAN